jgi:hypothetical protein
MIAVRVAGSLSRSTSRLVILRGAPAAAPGRAETPSIARHAGASISREKRCSNSGGDEEQTTGIASNAVAMRTQRLRQSPMIRIR